MALASLAEFEGVPTSEASPGVRIFALEGEALGNYSQPVLVVTPAIRDRMM